LKLAEGLSCANAFALAIRNPFPQNFVAPDEQKDASQIFPGCARPPARGLTVSRAGDGYGGKPARAG
jgi:hypothetical protein